MSATIADYQRKVAELATENRELRRRLAERDSAALAEHRRLRAERDEGLSPALTALRLAYSRALAERDELRDRLRASMERA